MSKDEVTNRERVKIDSYAVEEMSIKLERFIQAEGIAQMIRALMPDGEDSSPLAYDELVEYHNRLIKGQK